jgi:hypothetical protein
VSALTGSFSPVFPPHFELRDVAEGTMFLSLVQHGPGKQRRLCGDCVHRRYAKIAFYTARRILNGLSTMLCVLIRPLIWSEANNIIIRCCSVS